MRLSDWCDVAWAYVLRQQPMMASPTEYRDLLWNALYVGELTPEQRAKQLEQAAKRPAGAPSKMPRSAYAEMDEMMRQARQLRGEDPEPPDA